jgi:hypothetical protein
MDMPDAVEPGRPRRRPLAGLVDSILGMPQPGHNRRQQLLEDELVPAFLDNARASWFLSEPHRLDLGCVYDALRWKTEVAGSEISQLKDLLEEMRVFDLLEAVATSPDLPVLTGLNHAYEVGLLNHAGHPRASGEFRDLMRKVVANPAILAEAPTKLDQAAEATLAAHRVIGEPRTFVLRFGTFSR